ncbi:MAG: hypothetical protein GYA17_11880, partial [Chloroflexi bacterium]|nr:hypothetical protein [Chloroflexota bacterium]
MKLNKMHWFFNLVLVLAMAISVIGCQPQTPVATDAPAAAEEEEATVEEAAPATGEVQDVMSLDDLNAALGPMEKASKEYVIGAIVKTLVNEHWQQVKAGYEAAAADLGVKVEVVGADSEADLQQQLDFAET